MQLGPGVDLRQGSSLSPPSLCENTSQACSSDMEGVWSCCHLFLILSPAIVLIVSCFNTHNWQSKESPNREFFIFITGTVSNTQLLIF